MAVTASLGQASSRFDSAGERTAATIGAAYDDIPTGTDKADNGAEILDSKELEKLLVEFGFTDWASRQQVMAAIFKTVTKGTGTVTVDQVIAYFDKLGVEASDGTKAGGETAGQIDIDELQAAQTAANAANSKAIKNQGKGNIVDTNNDTETFNASELNNYLFNLGITDPGERQILSDYLMSDTTGKLVSQIEIKDIETAIAKMDGTDTGGTVETEEIILKARQLEMSGKHTELKGNAKTAFENLLIVNTKTNKITISGGNFIAFWKTQDDDDATGKKIDYTAKKVSTLTEPQKAYLYTMAEAVGVTKDEVDTYLKVNKNATLQDLYNKVLNEKDKKGNVVVGDELVTSGDLAAIKTAFKPKDPSKPTVTEMANYLASKLKSGKQDPDPTSAVDENKLIKLLLDRGITDKPELAQTMAKDMITKAAGNTVGTTAQEMAAYLEGLDGDATAEKADKTNINNLDDNLMLGSIMTVDSKGKKTIDTQKLKNILDNMDDDGKEKVLTAIFKQNPELLKDKQYTIADIAEAMKTKTPTEIITTLQGGKYSATGSIDISTAGGIDVHVLNVAKGGSNNKALNLDVDAVLTKEDVASVATFISDDTKPNPKVSSDKLADLIQAKMNIANHEAALEIANMIIKNAGGTSKPQEIANYLAKMDGGSTTAIEDLQAGLILSAVTTGNGANLNRASLESLLNSTSSNVVKEAILKAILLKDNDTSDINETEAEAVAHAMVKNSLGQANSTKQMTDILFGTTSTSDKPVTNIAYTELSNNINIYIDKNNGEDPRAEATKGLLTGIAPVA